MFKKFPAARRVAIYMILSYLSLVIVNNSGLEFDNMWIIYTPMFIAVYVFSRWLDSRLGNNAALPIADKKDVDEKGFGG